MTRSWWLAKKKNKEIAVQPVPDKINKKVNFQILHEIDDFNPSNGTMNRGSVTCLVCGQSAPSEHLKREGLAGQISATMTAVVYNAPGKTGKFYRAPTEEDQKLFIRSRDCLDIEQLPDELIPSHSSRAIFVHLYGFTQWKHLYNDRQSVAVSTIVKKLKLVHNEMIQRGSDESYATAVTTCLTMALDRLVDQTSTLVTWIYQLEAISHVFTRQALAMVWDYVEGNVFNDGGGGFTSAVNWVYQSILSGAKASTTFASLEAGDAARLNYVSNSMDAVVTDPPYYDAVPYADLSDYFYVWMKRTLGQIYPNIFMTPLTPKSTEIVQEPGRHDTEEEARIFYEFRMTKAFSEAQRVMRQEGIFTVVFAHKSTSAWETLINSLLDSGLVVTASWPLNTERSVRLRAQNSGALASSIFIVCRKRIAETDGIYDDVRPLMKTRIKERLDYFWKQGIRGADFFISAIGPAVEVFGQYKTVRKLSGDVVTVAELLDIVQQEVADYALSQVMNGGAAFGPFDAPTRFYIMYRWSYGKNKIEFDDGMRLAMALGAEVDLLMHVSSVLKKSGSSVTLLGPYDREDNEKLGEPARDRMAAPLIDMVHRSALLWRAGAREELARYVSTHVGTRVEALRAVAQALVNVLPDGDKEKQLYEGFLQGELPSGPTTSQLSFMDDEF